MQGQSDYVNNTQGQSLTHSAYDDTHAMIMTIEVQYLPEMFVGVRLEGVLLCADWFADDIVCSETGRYPVDLLTRLKSKHRLHTTSASHTAPVTLCYWQW